MKKKFKIKSMMKLYLKTKKGKSKITNIRAVRLLLD
jgi:hypothetical protein